MSSSTLPVDLKRPAALRWLAYYFLWVAHLVEPLPFATPLSVAVFVFAHLDVLRIPRRWSLEMVLAVVVIIYVCVLLVIHRTVFTVNNMGELAQSARIPYRLTIFLMFALCDYRLALEGPLLKTGIRVGGILAAVSLYAYMFRPDLKLIEGRRFIAGENVVGLFSNHNVMASAMGALCIGAFAWWLHKRTFRNQWELSFPELTALPFIAVAFLIARSRSFMVAGLCTGLYAGFFRSGSGFLVRLGAVAITVVGLVAGLYVLASRDVEQSQRNVEIRFQYFRRALDMVPISPLIGIGIGTFSEENVQYRWKVPGVLALRYSGERIEDKDFREDSEGAHVHNMYLETLLDVGLIGVVTLAMFFYAGVQRYFRIRRIASETYEPSSFLERACLNGDMYMLSLVFLLVSGLASGFTLFGVPSSLILYAALGRMVALSEPVEQEQYLAHEGYQEYEEQPEESGDPVDVKS